jgi:hypothetical protein
MGKVPAANRPHLVLELRAEPRRDPHSDYPRLRKALKAMLRGYGYRVVGWAWLLPEREKTR